MVSSRWCTIAALLGGCTIHSRSSEAFVLTSPVSNRFVKRGLSVSAVVSRHSHRDRQLTVPTLATKLTDFVNSREGNGGRLDKSPAEAWRAIEERNIVDGLGGGLAALAAVVAAATAVLLHPDMAAAAHTLGEGESLVFDTYCDGDEDFSSVVLVNSPVLFVGFETRFTICVPGQDFAEMWGLKYMQHGPFVHEKPLTPTDSRQGQVVSFKFNHPVHIPVVP